MSGSRGSVHHFNSSSFPYFPPQDVSSGSADIINRETFTMYSRPSAFGPPTFGVNKIEATTTTIDLATISVHKFDIADRFLERTNAVSTNRTYIYDQASIEGYNFPFTPPYYHGEAWCHITFTASSDSMTIKEIQSSSSYDYTRYDASFFSVTSSKVGTGALFLFPDVVGFGPQAFGNDNINKNAVQLSASLNIQGIGTIKKKGGGASAGSLIVDTAVGENSRWVIQTKFETPMRNVNHISGSDHLTLPLYGSGSVPRGMWHQYGRKPEESEGVFLQVGPIPDNYQTQVMNKATPVLDMSEALGFSGVGTKLGRLANKKEISEAVVAIPFIKEEGKRKFFKIDKDKVDIYKKGLSTENEDDYRALTNGEPSSQIGRSVLDQMEKMKKYIFPPSFDFINFDTETVAPIAMYIFEFSHTLTQTDLQDIWQNLPPTIGTEMEVAEVAITHPLLKKELLGQGGEGGNDTIEMSDKLKWMVFKVKQRASSNYFKKTVLRNPEVNTEVESGNVTQDEFGQTSTIQYNWPYDFFSLVEMVRIDSEVEMGNVDFTDYTDTIPNWDAVQADREKIADMVGGLEDDVLPEVDVPEEVVPREERFPRRGERRFGSRREQTEGIFDSNPSIPAEQQSNYKIFKARFTVSANTNPFGGYQKNYNDTISAIFDIIDWSANNNVIQSALQSWTKEWYDTDPGFQQKKQESPPPEVYRAAGLYYTTTLSAGPGYVQEGREAAAEGIRGILPDEYEYLNLASLPDHEALAREYGVIE